MHNVRAEGAFSIGDLFLIKHAMPEVRREAPAPTWVLADAGRRGAQALAERLAGSDTPELFASREPKARETAEIVAAHLGRPVRVVEGLHEHERSRVPFLATPQWEAAVADFFARPSELVLGDETADAAHDRFDAALPPLLQTGGDHDRIVVAHGTVISLFVARRTGVDGFDLWRRLGLPSYVRLSLPEMRLLEVVERVG